MDQHDMIPFIKNHVSSRPEDFGLLIFTDRTPVLALNRDSRLIWDLIDGRNSLDAIVDQLLSDHPREMVREAVKEFLLACRELDMIDWKDDSAST